MNDQRNTEIMACDCNHEYQDKRYGKGKRVHNPKQGKTTTKWRCTVCGKEK